MTLAPAPLVAAPCSPRFPDDVRADAVGPEPEELGGPGLEGDGDRCTQQPELSDSVQAEPSRYIRWGPSLAYVRGPPFTHLLRRSHTGSAIFSHILTFPASYSTMSLTGQVNEVTRAL